jgi:hypothetical protein
MTEELSSAWCIGSRFHWSTLPRRSTGRSRTPTSPDGQFFLGYTQIDAGGNANVELVDTSRPAVNAVTLEQDTDAFVYAQIATSDSSHALYYTFDAGFNTTLFAASRDGSKRQVSQGFTGIETYPLHGSVIALGDNFQGDGTSELDTADIEVVDVGAHQITPSVIAAGAYVNYFPTLQGHALVFTSKSGPLGAGLYAAHL